MIATRFKALIGFAVFAVCFAQSFAGDPPAKNDTLLRPVSILSLAFSPDGKMLVAATGEKDQPKSVIAWHTDTWKRCWEHTGGGPYASISFAPDGKTIAAAHSKPTALRLDAATGTAIGEIGPHPKGVRMVIHIPETDLLATGSDGVIRLWDLKTGKVARELRGHLAEVGRLQVSPEGRWLVSIGPDTARAWDLMDGTELKNAIEKRRDGYDGITFVSANRVLLCDSLHKIIELPSGKEIIHFKNSGGGAASSYSPKAGLLALRWHSDSTVWIADLTFRSPTGVEQPQIDKLLKDFDDDSYEVRVAATAAMRKLGSVAEPALRAATTNGASPEVRIRARETRKTILDEPLRQLKGHTGPVGPMAFSPDGKLLATGAGDGTIRLWDPQTGKEVRCLEVKTPLDNPSSPP